MIPVWWWGCQQCFSVLNNGMKGLLKSQYSILSHIKIFSSNTTIHIRSEKNYTFVPSFQQPWKMNFYIHFRDCYGQHWANHRLKITQGSRLFQFCQKVWEQLLDQGKCSSNSKNRFLHHTYTAKEGFLYPIITRVK